MVATTHFMIFSVIQRYNQVRLESKDTEMQKACIELKLNEQKDANAHTNNAI